jgi:hypothetical protein
VRRSNARARSASGIATKERTQSAATCSFEEQGSEIV